MKILVVDDEWSVRETLGTFLTDCGHAVRTASSAEEALWLLEEEPAELILSDLKMPGLSGIDLLRRVRERWPATEVVLITGYGTMDDAVEALRLGAYDFVLKPVRLARLELLVRHCAERIQFSKDNRELREVVERLREVNESKEKFIALANHEIRTPTTVAAGLVALLAEKQEDLPEPLRKLVVGAQRALGRLKEVVEDLGDLGLAQGGEFRLERGSYPLAELLDALESICAMYRDLRDLTITVERPPQADAQLFVDRRKLLRALSALIQNAVKYTPDGGSVRLGVDVSEQRLTFRVEDTGVGVAPGQEERIFDLFYEAADVRHHRTSAHEFGGGGLGVGLPLAQVIARAHGGGVSFSTRPESGSVFRLEIGTGAAS